MVVAIAREGKGSRLKTILKSEVLGNETWSLSTMLVNGLAQTQKMRLANPARDLTNAYEEKMTEAIGYNDQA